MNRAHGYGFGEVGEKKKKEWKESDVYLKSWKAANIISGERYNGSTGV